ncbi:MAG: hypothetical protein AMK69_26825 [Nitrospira bacterium SG8_3]|nr:MAG: hypothetical protein AMK69_26825 [Nitrospira bacterium SG8_3]
MRGVPGLLTGEDVKELFRPFAVGVPMPPKYYSCALGRFISLGNPDRITLEVVSKFQIRFPA